MGPVRGYAKVDGVEPGSDTETFVALRLEIENWRWAGVPILVRAGKALPVTATEIVIRLQRVPELQWGGHRLYSPGYDDIVLRIGRHAGMSIYVCAKTPGKEVSSPSRSISTSRRSWASRRSRTSGCSRTCSEAIRRSSPDGSVIEETWRIVQPLLDSPPPVERYEPGTWGPGLLACARAPRTAAGASRSRQRSTR